MGVRPTRLLENVPIVVLPVVRRLVMFGLAVVDQQRPETNTLTGPLLVMVPPHTTVLLVRSVAGLVLIEGFSTIASTSPEFFLQPANARERNRKKNNFLSIAFTYLLY